MKTLIKCCNQQHNTQPPARFMASITPALFKNWRILFVQSFTVSMPLLTTTNAFGSGRRRLSSQQCYLHCLHTSYNHSYENELKALGYVMRLFKADWNKFFWNKSGFEMNEWRKAENSRPSVLNSEWVRTKGQVSVINVKSASRMVTMYTHEIRNKNLYKIWWHVSKEGEKYYHKLYAPLRY